MSFPGVPYPSATRSIIAWRSRVSESASRSLMSLNGGRSLAMTTSMNRPEGVRRAVMPSIAPTRWKSAGGTSSAMSTSPAMRAAISAAESGNTMTSIRSRCGSACPARG